MTFTIGVYAIVRSFMHCGLMEIGGLYFVMIRKNLTQVAIFFEDY